MSVRNWLSQHLARAPGNAFFHVRKSAPVRIWDRLAFYRQRLTGIRAGDRLAHSRQRLTVAGPPAEPAGSEPGNPLLEYFDAHREGPGVWKWRHYFDIYHRHLSKFRGRSPTVLEIGIHSGGSLGMWRQYFGPGTTVYATDIEPVCKSHQADGVHVLLGDQADRAFWSRFRHEAPPVDIVIDDGGHEPRQQVVTLEETLAHMRPGGVYICEDVQGSLNPFSSYIYGLSRNLNDVEGHGASADPERDLYSPATTLQSAIESVHLYTYLVVVERRENPVAEFVSQKHGTEWNVFVHSRWVKLYRWLRQELVRMRSLGTP
jgi:hypothetical protein